MLRQHFAGGGVLHFAHLAGDVQGVADLTAVSRTDLMITVPSGSASATIPLICTATMGRAELWHPTGRRVRSALVVASPMMVAPKLLDFIVDAGPAAIPAPPAPSSGPFRVDSLGGARRQNPGRGGVDHAGRNLHHALASDFFTPQCERPVTANQRAGANPGAFNRAAELR